MKNKSKAQNETAAKEAKKAASKDASPKEAAPQETASKEATPKANGKSKPASKPEKPEADSEPSDRLPGSIDELKESKSGLATYLFLTGKDKEAIANELKTAFKLADAQAVKIARRMTGRARFFQRALELTKK